LYNAFSRHFAYLENTGARLELRVFDTHTRETISFSVDSRFDDKNFAISADGRTLAYRSFDDDAGNVDRIKRESSKISSRGFSR
jgi:hypothetical protein